MSIDVNFDYTVLDTDPIYNMADGDQASQVVDQISDIASKVVGVAGIAMSLINTIVAITKERTFREGEYRIGERFMYHILDQGIFSQKAVPDQVVPIAQLYFTIMFGVFIDDAARLDALQVSADAYKYELMKVAFLEKGYSFVSIDFGYPPSLPFSQKKSGLVSPTSKAVRSMSGDINSDINKPIITDIFNTYIASSENPLWNNKAIDRAVMLKQTYYRESTPHWNPMYFYQFPLVAPIPSPREKITDRIYYTGDLPGGGQAVNGQITYPSTAITSEKWIADHPGISGVTDAINAVTNTVSTVAKNNPFILIAVIGIILVIIILIIRRKK